MKKAIVSMLSILCLTNSVIAAEGIINVPSAYNVVETADRVETILNKKGLMLFNRIKHSKGAAKHGIELRETELIIFGNPKVGGPLMKCQQSAAIDLPQKALIWEDNEAGVWISYNDPRYLQKRHNITGCEEHISKIEKALAGIANSAARD